MAASMVPQFDHMEIGILWAALFGNPRYFLRSISLISPCYATGFVSASKTSEQQVTATVDVLQNDARPRYCWLTYVGFWPRIFLVTLSEHAKLVCQLAADLKTWLGHGGSRYGHES